jgi:hypothetical protein
MKMKRKVICFLFFQVMEHLWNEIDRRKPKYSGKNLSQCHFVNHKSHMDSPGIEPGPPRWESGTDRLSHGTAIIFRLLNFIVSAAEIIQPRMGWEDVVSGECVKI